MLPIRYGYAQTENIPFTITTKEICLYKLCENLLSLYVYQKLTFMEF